MNLNELKNHGAFNKFKKLKKAPWRELPALAGTAGRLSAAERRRDARAPPLWGNGGSA